MCLLGGAPCIPVHHMSPPPPHTQHTHTHTHTHVHPASPPHRSPHAHRNGHRLVQVTFLSSTPGWSTGRTRMKIASPRSLLSHQNKIVLRGGAATRVLDADAAHRRCCCWLSWADRAAECLLPARLANCDALSNAVSLSLFSPVPPPVDSCPIRYAVTARPLRPHVCLMLSNVCLNQPTPSVHCIPPVVTRARAPAVHGAL